MVNVEQNGEYKNIQLKTKYKWNAAKKMFDFDAQGEKIVTKQGMAPDETIIVEKVFAEGREVVGKFGTSFSCRVLYGTDEVTFWLDEYEHTRYADIGGEGDKVKITLKLVDKLNKKLGVKVPTQQLYFEAA